MPAETRIPETRDTCLRFKIYDILTKIRNFDRVVKKSLKRKKYATNCRTTRPHEKVKI